MVIKALVIYVLVFIVGIVVANIWHTADKDERPVKSGTVLIRKNDEAIDGQVQFTRDLWNISTHKEITLKIKVVPGEPGDWEEKKNG